MRRLSLAAFVVVTVPILCSAQTRQQAINDAVTFAERVCLVGTRYKFNLDVTGKLTITKILPGADAKVAVDGGNAPGGVLFEKEEIRQLVDADIRKCMADQWPRILEALQPPERPRPEPTKSRLDSLREQHRYIESFGVEDRILASAALFADANGGQFTPGDLLKTFNFTETVFYEAFDKLKQASLVVQKDQCDAAVERNCLDIFDYSRSRTAKYSISEKGASIIRKKRLLRY